MLLGRGGGSSNTEASLLEVREPAQGLLRAPNGACFLTNHTAGDLDLAYAMGLTDREAAPLMRACTGKVTTDTTNPVTVEVEDEAWMRAVCAPIMLAGGGAGGLWRCGGRRWASAPARRCS